MSVSSVSTSTPVTPIATGETKTPDTSPEVKNDNAKAYQPPPPPPLPPGQGTRVNQLV
jgi:hypothetical protein